jgi:plasmid stabilization system protein ParE
MAYLVRITRRAELDLDAIYAAINAEYSATAFRWFNRLERALLTLEQMPARCPVTPEDAHLRHLLYGKKPHIYRVIYRVMENREEVEILHIRHGARQAFQADDLTI